MHDKNFHCKFYMKLLFSCFDCCVNIIFCTFAASLMIFEGYFLSYFRSKTNENEMIIMENHHIIFGMKRDVSMVRIYSIGL